MRSLAAHAPFSVADLLRVRRRRVVDDGFGFLLRDTVTGDMVQIPIIPSKGRVGHRISAKSIILKPRILKWYKTGKYRGNRGSGVISQSSRGNYGVIVN